jgi:hypothetical protein
MIFLSMSFHKVKKHLEIYKYFKLLGLKCTTPELNALRRLKRVTRCHLQTGSLYHMFHGCAADFSLLNLPKGKSLGRSKPATNS